MNVAIQQRCRRATKLPREFAVRES